MNKISAKISKLEHRGNIHIKVDIPNTPTARQLIREIAGRKFSRTHRCWYIPNTLDAMDALKKSFDVKQIFEKKEIPDIDLNETNHGHPESLSTNKISQLIRVEPEHDFRVKVFIPWERKDWIQQIKSLPNRAWNKEKKYWSVPKNLETLYQLKQSFGNNLKISNQIQWTSNVQNKSSKNSSTISSLANEEQLQVPKEAYQKELCIKQSLP